MTVTITIERDDDGNVTTSVVKNGEPRYVDHIEQRMARHFLWAVLTISKLYSQDEDEDENGE